MDAPNTPVLSVIYDVCEGRPEGFHFAFDMKGQQDSAEHCSFLPELVSNDDYQSLLCPKYGLS